MNMLAMDATTWAHVPVTVVGGLPIARLDRKQTVSLMISTVKHRQRGERPYYMTSANGEVIARANTDAEVAELFAQSDTIAADGQAMVVASRFLCSNPLPMRVATTDLFHDVADRAEREGVSFYMLGAAPNEVERAVAATQKRYPALRLVGFSHGYLRGEELEAKLVEINALAPDIVWLAMGVPIEQQFMRDHGDKLGNVGLVKTSGGLFNFLSGSAWRAPLWLQNLGMEWLWRASMEPRRLAWRYFVTSPVAIYMIAKNSR